MCLQGSRVFRGPGLLSASHPPPNSPSARSKWDCGSGFRPEPEAWPESLQEEKVTRLRSRKCNWPLVSVAGNAKAAGGPDTDLIPDKRLK